MSQLPLRLDRLCTQTCMKGAPASRVSTPMPPARPAPEARMASLRNESPVEGSSTTATWAEHRGRVQQGAQEQGLKEAGGQRLPAKAGQGTQAGCRPCLPAHRDCRVEDGTATVQAVEAA